MNFFSRFKLTLLSSMVMTGVAFGGPVSYYGKIKADKNRIKSEDGLQTVQLKGPSLFWSTLSADKFYNKLTVDWFVENMNISVIRAAMAIKYYKQNSQPIYTSTENFGYLSPEVPNAKALMTERIERVIQAAIKNDIYVIVDWHSHNAENETSEAAAFFGAMAAKYKDCPNIIWEIYNEPITSWGTISTYANTVIDAIRNAGSTNLIIVGTSNYSQNPNEGNLSKTNVAYVLHFYAATHGSSLRSNGDAALNNGKAVFVSEWGSVDAYGTGSPNASSSNEWISWMNTNSISSCYWSIMDNGDPHGIFNSGTGNNYSMSALSASGQIFKSFMGSGIAAPSGYPSANDTTVVVVGGVSKTLSAELKISAGASISAISPVDASLGAVSFTANSISYTPPAANLPSEVDVIYTVTSGTKNTKWRATFKINRAPTVKDVQFNVSYRSDLTNPFGATLSSMGVVDPDQTVPTLVSATGGAGIVTINAAKTGFTYRPAANFLGSELTKNDVFTYVVTDGVQQASGTITFVVQSFAPTVLESRTISLANTATQTINRKTVSALDADEDSITFAVAQVMNENYPATAVIAADGKTVLFTPAPNMIGQAVVRIRVTDGKNESKDCYLYFNITGSGSQIPTYTVGTLQTKKIGVSSMQFKNGHLQLEIPKSGLYSIKAYNLMGVAMGTTFHGTLNSGSHEMKLNMDSWPKGIYLVRLNGLSMQQTLQITKE